MGSLIVDRPTKQPVSGRRNRIGARDVLMAPEHTPRPFCDKLSRPRMRIGFDVSPLHRPHPRGVVRVTAGLVGALERRGVLEVVRLAPPGPEASAKAGA